MMPESLHEILRARFAAAIAQVTNADPATVDAVVRPAPDAKFGDYQCNAAMALAKTMGAKPHDVARSIVGAVRADDIAEPLEIAGPGFINVRLKREFLAKCLTDIPKHAIAVPTSPRHAGQSDRLNIPPASAPQRVVVDYSSPNIAKQMHVGHIRSTIIGDVIARVIGFRGDDVIRQNHVGDWGTQMGMVILGIWHVYRLRNTPEGADDAAAIRYFAAGLRAVDAKITTPDSRKAFLDRLAQDMLDGLRTENDPPTWSAWLGEFEQGRARVRPTLDVLTAAYRFVNAVEDAPEAQSIIVPDIGRSDAPIPLARLSNHVVAVMLHVKHPEELHAWSIARDISIRDAQSMYDRLGVLLTPQDVCGESFYHERLAKTVADLRRLLPVCDKSQPAAGPYAELRDDRGAVCIFLYDAQHQPRFKNPEGGELPILIQKSDGAFLYSTTDLAAVRYRAEELGAKRLIYVTDARQVQHFQQFFAAARAVGWAPQEVLLEHVTFGSVLGEDRKPVKTRSGESIMLRELLDEAEERALQLVEDRELQAPADAPRFSADEKRNIARVVGVAAVKYADLKNDRRTDYLFSWDKMLSLQGNTAPYLLYAYARLRSILREAASRFGAAETASDDAAIRLEHAAERALALRILRLREALAIVAAELTPHVLCAYLYDLASDLTQFYEACPVLKAPDDETRRSRLRLCELAARTMRLGLNLLGIEPLERM